jgi:hypothetical protein
MSRSSTNFAPCTLLFNVVGWNCHCPVREAAQPATHEIGSTLTHLMYIQHYIGNEIEHSLLKRYLLDEWYLSS